MAITWGFTSGIKKLHFKRYLRLYRKCYYVKRHRALRFDIGIYKDESKTAHIANKSFEVNGYQNYRRVAGYTNQIPKTPIENEFWIVQDGAQLPWQGYEGCLTAWDKRTATWQFWYFGDEILYYLPTKTYYTFNQEAKKLEPVPLYKIEDAAWWDSIFSADVIFSDKTNLYKQIYLYLKTLPGFENVVDC